MDSWDGCVGDPHVGCESLVSLWYPLGDWLPRKHWGVIPFLVLWCLIGAAGRLCDDERNSVEVGGGDWVALVCRLGKLCVGEGGCEVDLVVGSQWMVKEILT
jgi:hypothetical protein